MPRLDTRLSETYLRFAELEAKGNCKIYEYLCTGVARDNELLSLIEALPLAKRQPNLLLAAARWHGAPLESYVDFSEWTVRNWGQVSATMRTRSTQTNEAARMDTIAPVLAKLPQPLALLEVGASAGLCLYPQAPEIQVAWRAGLDLNPLDVTNDDHMRWLECLVWPSQPHRLARLHAAIQIARRHPPYLVQGDLNHDLESLIAQAPSDATLVVFHTAVLAYVSEPGRAEFARRMSSLAGHWISNEAPGVLHHIEMPRGMANVLALDGTPVAFTGGHGQAFQWLV